MDQYLPVAVLSGVAAVWFELFEIMGVGSFRNRLGISGENCPKQILRDYPDGEPNIMHRAKRAQQNQVEQLLVFFPSLWAHAVFVDPTSAVVAGSLWLVLRMGYGLTYRSDQEGLPNIMPFTLPCYHIIGYLALGPLGIYVQKKLELPWWAAIVAGVAAWGLIFGSAVAIHRSYGKQLDEIKEKSKLNGGAGGEKEE